MRQKRLYSGWGLVWGLLVTLPLLLLATYLAARSWMGNFGGAGGPLETLPVWLLLGFLAFRGLWRGFAARRYVLRYARDVLASGGNRVLLGPHQLQLDARGVHFGSEFHQTHLQWEALESVAMHGAGLVLMWSPASGFLVPGRAFVDRSEYDDFLATCRHFAPHLHLEATRP
jgi:hypothetical protein